MPRTMGRDVYKRQRYDDMVGKFLGQKVPAVGFSIGLERICSILLDQGYAVPDEKPDSKVFHPVFIY